MSSSSQRLLGETNSVESYEELQVILASEQTPREPFAINLTEDFVLEIVREAMGLMIAIDMDAIPKESRMDAFDFMNLVRAEIAKVMECRRPNVTRRMLGPDGPRLTEEAGLTNSAEALLKPGSMLVLRRCAGSLLNLLEKFRALDLPLKFPEPKELEGPQGTLEGDQRVEELVHSTENETVMLRDVGEGGTETETLKVGELEQSTENELVTLCDAGEGGAEPEPETLRAAELAHSTGNETVFPLDVGEGGVETETETELAHSIESEVAMLRDVGGGGAETEVETLRVKKSAHSTENKTVLPLDADEGGAETETGTLRVTELANSAESEMVMLRHVGEGGAETEPETLVLVENTNVEDRGEEPRVGGSEDGDRDEERIPPFLFQSLEKLQSSINHALDVCRIAIAEGAKFQATLEPSSPSADQI